MAFFERNIASSFPNVVAGLEIFQSVTIVMEWKINQGRYMDYY